MGEFLPWILLTTISLVLLIWAEWDASQLRRGIFKTLASTGFVVAGLASGAVESWYGLLILIGLACSWCGDAFLLSASDRLFKAGTGCFLVAHVAYGTAFVVLGVSPWASVAALILLIPVVVVVIRWLFPDLPAPMRGLAIVYIVVITAMVALATGAASVGGRYVVVVGAAAFYLSDLFVARDRFVTPSFANTLGGLPLYYGAQLLFAYSVTLSR
jgi:uncharacterized membrane protein YhhN